MAFLKLNGWAIPVSRGSVRAEPEAVGGKTRTKWSMETTVLSAAEARALAGLLSAGGDAWSFDVDFWSENGVGPSQNTVARTTGGLGKYGEAVEVLSPNRLDYPSYALRPRRGGFSLWLYATQALVDSTTVRRVFYHGNSSDRQRVLLERTGDGRWLVVVGDAVNLGHHIYVDGPDTVGWHHFALSWSEDEIALWINGARVGTVESPLYLPTQIDSVFQLGHTAGANQIESRLDEVSVFGFPLCDKMVSGIYSLGRSMPAPPVLWAEGDLVADRARRVEGTLSDVSWQERDRATVSFSLAEEL